MRCYSRGLKPNEIYENYLSVLGTNQYNEVNNRNSAEAKTVYFTRNQTPSEQAEKFWEDEELVNLTFSELNQITSKYDLYNEKGEFISYGSKTALVNCTMHYYDGENWQKETDVDVFLQGTSTLEYPVKNYKIKVYDHNTREEKLIFPPFVSKGLDEWYTKSSVYTLKCDYMDHSHRNNTPTAMYFDTVLRGVIDAWKGPDKYNDFYSPPKTTGVYRDTIEGRPILVHYIDLSSKKEEDINLFSTILKKINSKNSSDNNSN
jgi:hypothetical protein